MDLVEEADVLFQQLDAFSLLIHGYYTRSMLDEVPRVDIKLYHTDTVE